MPQMCPICSKITFPLFDVPNIYMFTHLPKKKASKSKLSRDFIANVHFLSYLCKLIRKKKKFC